MIGTRQAAVDIGQYAIARGDNPRAGWLDASRHWEEGGVFMQEAHLSALEAKHAGLEAQIEEENQRPMPDTATLHRLKKEKLKIKEEMEGITHH
jgi:hypothetical protein